MKTLRVHTGLLLTIGIISSTAFFSCTGPPEASDITLINNPNEHVPLAGVLTFSADRPVKAMLTIDDGVKSWTVTPSEDLKNSHEIPVLGLRADRHYEVGVTISDENGRETVLPPLGIDTPPLPDDFPKYELTTPASGTLEPGVTMINVFRWKGMFSDDPEWGLVFAVDEEGEVIWYYKADYPVGEARRLHNGNLFFGAGEDGRLYEIDMLGNIIREWHTSGAVTKEVPDNSIPVNTDTFHHDVIELSTGNFIALGLEVRHDEDFPLEYAPGTKRGPSNLASDVILEFSPEGETIRKYNLADIIDHERLGEGSLGQNFYETIYKDRFDSLEMPRDISHANALYYVEEEDALLVSSYTQCAVFKIDMGTGELKWILGDPTGWNSPWADKLLKPVGDITWPCHQHGLEMTSNGTVLMFDNGAGRNIPPNPPLPPDQMYSRAVEYRVNEADGTVEEVWSYGPEQEQFSSPFICDADQLPETGNILITDGGRFMDEEGNPVNMFGGHQWGRVLEVTRDDVPVKIWELTVKDPEMRYSVYRAQRLKSLYPGLDRPTG